MSKKKQGDGELWECDACGGQLVIGKSTVGPPAEWSKVEVEIPSIPVDLTRSDFCVCKSCSAKEAKLIQQKIRSDFEKRSKNIELP